MKIIIAQANERQLYNCISEIKLKHNTFWIKKLHNKKNIKVLLKV